MTIAETTWLAVAGLYVFSLSLIPKLVLSRRESAATMSWILALVFIPIVGLLAYWVFGERRLRRQVHVRRAKSLALAAALEEPRGRRCCPEDSVPERDRDVTRMITKICDSPPIPCNAIRVFIDPDEATQAMLSAIDAAKESIHLEVYIFKSDESGEVFREKLASAAKRGVKVRVLVDALGTFWTGRRFFHPIVAAGGKVGRFLPVIPLRGLYRANLRNHRKILVVDGKVGFTGGLNIGNEYGSWRRRRLGTWRDTHLEMKGPAVAVLQDVFVEDWHFTTGEEVSVGEAFPPIDAAGPELVHVLASGPDSDWEVIHHSIFTTITQATDHVYLTTPYFVPDRALLVALQTAALRGVDVRVLLPERSDQGLVRAAGRFHYQELLRAGIRVFEYSKQMLHAKTVEVDGRWSTIGSANLDLRSFRLNFEVNVVVYGEGVAADLRRMFLRDIETATEITDTTIRTWPLSSRFAYASARLVEALL